MLYIRTYVSDGQAIQPSQCYRRYVRVGHASGVWVARSFVEQVAASNIGTIYSLVWGQLSVKIH